MINGAAPGVMLKFITSAPYELLAAVIASRREQLASHAPLSSAVVVTVNVVCGSRAEVFVSWKESQMIKTTAAVRTKPARTSIV